MMMKKMCVVGKVSAALTLVGALNWGLIGAFQYNLVMALLGSWPVVERVVYVLVGLSAIVLAMHLMGKCKKCCSMEGGACKGGNCGGSASDSNTQAGK